MKSDRSLIAFGFLACLLSGGSGATPLAAENWPRFRGPGGSGRSDAANIPSQWTDQHYRWVTDLGGTGNSSPVIWGDRLFVTAADESSQQRWLICLNTADGTERWRAASQFTAYKKHKNNSFASSTPAVDQRHVYQLWHAKQQTSLIAYDHDGDEQWRNELGPYLHGQGGATSPIVAGELVVVAHDHSAGSHLIAIDRDSGQPRWRIPREGKRACYSTPCARMTAGGLMELVFVHCYEGVSGIDAKTGRQNWHIDPFGRDSQRALVSPIIAGNLVIAGSGAVGGERKIVAIAIDGEGADSSAHEVYRLVRAAPHVPTPIAIDDRLYLWGDGGIATCCDLASGDVVWQKRVGGTYFASPIAIEDRLFSIDTTGEVVVIAAGDEFSVLARNFLEEGSRASMAVSNDGLFIRTQSKVFAIGGP